MGVVEHSFANLAEPQHSFASLAEPPISPLELLAEPTLDMQVEARVEATPFGTSTSSTKRRKLAELAVESSAMTLLSNSEEPWVQERRALLQEDKETELIWATEASDRAERRRNQGHGAPQAQERQKSSVRVSAPLVVL